MLSQLIARQAELADTWSLIMTKPKGYVYTAGDYTELELDYPPSGGRRWFSLSSAPYEENLSITFRLPNPHSSFKRRLMELNPGDQLQLAPAMGNFNLPKMPQPVLLIAIGMGATPYRSIISQLIHAKQLPNWDIKLLHAAAAGDFLFKPVFSKLKNNYQQINPSKVRLSTEKIAELVSDAAKRMVYLAGPEVVTEKLHDQLLAAGWPRSALRLSFFPGYKGYSD